MQPEGAVAGPEAAGLGLVLRAERGGVDAKKTTNFEAMRDLSGRRMRHVNNEKKLQEWIDAAPEREAEARREKEAAKERKRAEAEHSRTEAEAVQRLLNCVAPSSR